MKFKNFRIAIYATICVALTTAVAPLTFATSTHDNYQADLESGRYLSVSSACAVEIRQNTESVSACFQSMPQAYCTYEGQCWNFWRTYPDGELYKNKSWTLVVTEKNRFALVRPQHGVVSVFKRVR